MVGRMSVASPVLTRNETCWICGSNTRLATRELPVFPLGEAATATTGQCKLATCFDCRAELHKHCDERKIALRPRTTAIVRYRAVDITLMMMTLAGGILIATALGWMAPVGYAVGAACVLLAFPLGGLNYALARRRERNRVAKWESSDQRKAADAFQAKLKSRFEDLETALKQEDLSLIEPTAATRGPSLIQQWLVHPEFWSPSAGQATKAEAASG